MKFFKHIVLLLVGLLFIVNKNCFAQPGQPVFTITDSFVVYLKAVLNPHQFGLKQDIFYAYSTRYGRRIGWGLPVTNKSFYKTGLTMPEADSILRVAIVAVICPIDSLIKKNFNGKKFNNLSREAQEILIDRAVTNGVNNLPDNFCKVVINNDWKQLLNGYIYVRNPDGWPDITMNKAFADRWIYGKTGKRLPINEL